MSDHTPIILVELVLVFGGVLAFGWWQLRDVKRAQAERRAREAAERARAGDQPAESPPPAETSRTEVISDGAPQRLGGPQ